MSDEEMERFALVLENIQWSFFAFLRKRNGERPPLSAPLVIRLWQNIHGISRKIFCKKHLRKGSMKFAFYQNRFKLLLLLISLMPDFTRGSYFSFSIFIEIKLQQFCGYFRGNFQQRFFLLLTFLWFLTFIKRRWVAFLMSFIFFRSFFQ